MNRLLYCRTRRFIRGLTACIAACLIAATVVNLAGPYPRYAAIFSVTALAMLIPLYAANID